MFRAVFSFEGRIRRTEYGISLLLYAVTATVLNAMIENSRNSGTTILILFYIPLLWFLWAQGAKRCHDLGNSGWYQIIPFYVLWMLFHDGQVFANEYGENPKEVPFAAQDVAPDAGMNENRHSDTLALQATQSVDYIIPQQSEKQQAIVSRQEFRTHSSLDYTHLRRSAELRFPVRKRHFTIVVLEG